jgi:hypothetical protein
MLKDKYASWLDAAMDCQRAGISLDSIKRVSLREYRIMVVQEVAA